ncbi:MAG: UDP-N-acetylglucosamine 2-epimerase (non-hydrolyzing) [Sphingomonas bacterium]|nr:UDP-N-acetylglucosamine 2-epimerase (non-hydrolyzing) [Sphingomonas bacterium]
MAAPKPGGPLYNVRVSFVIGTRPEAIKLAPVALELVRRFVPIHLYLTGQHPGLDLADHGLGGQPATRLGCAGRRDPIDHVDDVTRALELLWRRAPPELVIVQGDTSSALGGARAAHRCGLPLAHVEAGLRSFDPVSPWPEEQFRVEIDRLSDLLFAPTATAAANLHREGCEGTLHVTGNSGIDALLAELDRLPKHRRRHAARGPLKLLVTCHRRENWGTGLVSLAMALIELARRGDAVIDVVLHPNPQVAQAMFALLSDEPSVRLIAPLGHGAMIAAMRRADLILSDSGGVQEEAPALGVPLLVLRDATERPEGVAAGNALLVGTETARVVDAVTRLIDDRAGLATMAIPRFPFGDGQSAPRIAALALAWLDSHDQDARSPLSG